MIYCNVLFVFFYKPVKLVLDKFTSIFLLSFLEANLCSCLHFVCIHTDVHRGPSVNTRTLGKALLKCNSKESPCPKGLFVSGSNIIDLGKRCHLPALQMLNAEPKVLDFSNRKLVLFYWYEWGCCYLCWLGIIVFSNMEVPKYPSSGSSAITVTGGTKFVENPTVLCPGYFQSAHFKSVCRLSHGSLSWVADNADPIFTAQHVVAILPQAIVGLFLYQVVFTGLSAQLFVHKQLLLTGASECSWHKNIFKPFF